MNSLRQRREGKKRGAEEEEGGKTEEAKKNRERKRTIPAGAGREGISIGEEEAIRGRGDHGYSQSEATSGCGEDARVSHRQQGHPRQQGVWLLLIILGEALFIPMHEVVSNWTN